jgi:hypothetical protein
MQAEYTETKTSAAVTRTTRIVRPIVIMLLAKTLRLRRGLRPPFCVYELVFDISSST